MDEKWYYVDGGERKGPVDIQYINALIEKSALGDDDYVWKKGFENWMKIKNIPDFQPPEEESIAEMPGVIESGEVRLKTLTEAENSVFIKIGADRGGQEVEYGPYSLTVIQKLFEQHRINGKTFVFVRGMSDWMMLGEFADYAEIFEETPPPIKEEDRRKGHRKPFIARMYIESNKQVYVGVCRDISVGGMQVLVDHLPADIGQKISINVHPENTEYHFVASGQIVRLLDGGQGFSFRFIDLNDEAKEAIEKYLSNEQ
jgi:hypothetical protein